MDLKVPFVFTLYMLKVMPTLIMSYGPQCPHILKTTDHVNHFDQSDFFYHANFYLLERR